MSKTVTITSNSWDTTARTSKAVTITVTYPDDHRLHYDSNQQTLIILSASGEHVAAYRQIKSFVTPGLAEEIR